MIVRPTSDAAPGRLATARKYGRKCCANCYGWRNTGTASTPAAIRIERSGAHDYPPPTW